ncbi:MAG: hypothetical protein IKM70_02605 [Firmicutes bacterium]|nr:hypothetical protein [Bacillota bacterium]
MGYKRCTACGGYCWLPGRIGGYCPHCAAELTDCGRPAPVVQLKDYIKRREPGTAAGQLPQAERMRQI